MDKKAERLAKLKNLSEKRAESSQQNHREVVEEYKRMKLPSNFEKKKEWAEAKLDQEMLKEKMAKEGKDYERESYLEMQADEAERWERRKREKQLNSDSSFTSYEDVTARQYAKSIKSVKIATDEYERKREELGSKFYPSKETDVTNVHKDSKEKIDLLVEDLNKKMEKRNKFSRRRKLEDTHDVDYINEKNRRFNEVLERFYGDYTATIKTDLERGSAI